MSIVTPTTEQTILVGVVGGAASGKDTVAGIFAERGYAHVSSSDILREEIATRGKTTSRELQTLVANEMREQNGVGYWVDLSLSRVESGATKKVISGLYAPGEGEYLQRELGGILVGVVAGEGDDTETRYRRLAERSSGARDALSFSEFLTAHERENSGETAGQTNLSKLLGMANFIIRNSAGLKHLREQTDAIIKEVEGNYYE